MNERVLLSSSFICITATVMGEWMVLCVDAYVTYNSHLALVCVISYAKNGY